MAEIEESIQETSLQLAQLQSSTPPKTPAELAQREREFKRLTDQLQSLNTALQLQRTLGSEEQRRQERRCADASGKKMKNFGFREVRVRFLGGYEVKLLARYYARTQARAEKGKGAYFGLILLGIHVRCSPALASEVAKLAAAMNSLEDARKQLSEMGVKLSVKQIATIAYQFSQRTRLRQTTSGMGISASLAGKRVVVSTDGGRVRIRTNKRGKRTKKGRRRYRTDWREPKLLVIYVVDAQGKIEREFTPLLDGTLKGPVAVFRLIEFYLSELQVEEATKVLFIADGAKWIWKRVAGLWNRLKQGRVDAFVEEVKNFCRGKRGKDWRRERDYLLRNASAGRLNYGLARQHQLPNGSGIIESTVRRVLNLRMKGASIFWTKENAEDMILLRAYYKSGRKHSPKGWRCRRREELISGAKR